MKMEKCDIPSTVQGNLWLHLSTTLKGISFWINPYDIYVSKKEMEARNVSLLGMWMTTRCHTKI